MPNKNVRRGPAAGGAPSDFTNRNVANDMYVDGLTDNFTVGTGTSGILARTYLADNAAPTVVSGDQAISIIPSILVITKGSAAALTLAAPTAAQAGTKITITSRTAFAHVITTVSLVNNGVTGSPFNTITLAAFIGAGVTLIADNLKWNVIASAVGVNTYA